MDEVVVFVRGTKRDLIVSGIDSSRNGSGGKGIDEKTLNKGEIGKTRGPSHGASGRETRKETKKRRINERERERETKERDDERNRRATQIKQKSSEVKECSTLASRSS